MPTTEIFICRHGETEYNRTHRIQGRGIDEALNETGRSQARSIGEFLEARDIKHIFSSSLKRSIETAQIIADTMKLSVQSHPQLDEMDFGVIEGQPISEIGDHLNKLHTAWKGGDTAFALEQGESPDTVLKRVRKRTDMLVEKHRGQSILFVLHGRLIRILLANWLGYGLTQMHRVKHQNGALYQLRQGEDNDIESVFLNQTKHLEAIEEAGG